MALAGGGDTHLRCLLHGDGHGATPGVCSGIEHSELRRVGPEPRSRGSLRSRCMLQLLQPAVCWLLPQIRLVLQRGLSHYGPTDCDLGRMSPPQQYSCRSRPSAPDPPSGASTSYPGPGRPSSHDSPSVHPSTKRGQLPRAGGQPTRDRRLRRRRLLQLL